MKKQIREWGIVLGLAIIIFLLFHFIIDNSVVDGQSMQPALYQGQRLFVVKVFLEPGRGDIIIIHPPIAPNEEFVKRLIGLPGDTIEIKNGTVYVNGILLNEPYIKDKPTYTYGPVKVPPNNYFVLGDNRNASTDSHFGWTVTRQEIVGKAWLRYWPFSKWGLPGNYPLNEEVTGSSSALDLAMN